MNDKIAIFTGFPASGTQFLRNLAENNHKEWFEAHKQTYLEAVQEPALGCVDVST